MKKEKDYLKVVKLNDGKQVQVMCKVDLNNKAKVSCFYQTGGKTMPDYYKIVLPVGLLEKTHYAELGDKNITFTTDEIIDQKISKRVAGNGQKNTVYTYKTQELPITPNKLVSQLKRIYQNDQFDLETQAKFILDKKAHWGFTARQKQWLDEVVTKANFSGEGLKVTSALMQNTWNTSFGAVTKGQALCSLGIIIFNQNYKDTYDEVTFKETFTHELAHLKNFKSFGFIENGHNAEWILKNYELNTKVFGPKSAKFLLARDLYRYGSRKIKYKYTKPDITEYFHMKEQATLAHVATKLGYKLESDNPFIEKINKNSRIRTTVRDFLEKQEEQFNIFESWQPPRFRAMNSYSPMETFFNTVDGKDNLENQVANDRNTELDNGGMEM